MHYFKNPPHQIRNPRNYFSLAESNPELIKEWDFEANTPLTPQDVTPGSEKKVGWICQYHHKWQAIIYNRARNKDKGTGCPTCAGHFLQTLAESNPELISEWDLEANAPLTPQIVSAGSNKKIWWICQHNQNHKWQAKIVNRARQGTGCPTCAGHLLQTLAESNPKLIEEWDFDANAPLTPQDVSSGSEKKIWWICKRNKNHKWQAVIFSRARQGNGCPVCAGHLLQTLAESNPELILEWDFKTNAPLTPQDVSPGSQKKVGWICQYNRNHQWQARIANRSRSGKGCPHCYRENRKKKILKKFDPTGRKGSSNQSPRRSTRGGRSFDIGPERPNPQYQCQLCHQYGHNKRTCPQAGICSFCVSQGFSGKGHICLKCPYYRHCKICQLPGHTSQKCSEREPFGFAPRSPKGAPETEFDETISGLTDLFQKNPEMNSEEQEFKIIRIPAKKILTSIHSFNNAILNIMHGMGSRSKGKPLKIWIIEDGRYLLVDGQHRFAEGVRKKQKYFQAIIIGEGYTDYWATPMPGEEYKITPKKPGEEYKLNPFQPRSNPLHRGPPIDPDSEFLPWIPHGKLINLGNNKWQCPTCSMISSKPSFEILRCFKPHLWITNLAKKYGLIKKQWHLHTHASAWQCNYCQMTTSRFEDFEEIQCPYTPEPCKYCGDTPICAQDCLGIAAALSGELTPDMDVKFLGPGQEPPNVNPSSLENLDPENIKHLCLDCQKVYQGPEDAPITSHGYCPSCGKLQLQKLRAMTIHQEILKVNQLAKALQTWNLKYDVFPLIEPPKLPYGVPEATDFLGAVAEIRSQNYWGLIPDSSKLNNATQRWHNLVKDLAGEYGLQDLYTEPWLSY